MESTKQKSYVLPIAMMFALFAMISFVTGLPNLSGQLFKMSSGHPIFEATLGFFANFIAYAFMGIPAGMLLQKIGYKKTALIAIVVGFVGVGIQVLSSKGICHLRCRCICFRFLHVYVEYSRKPDVEHIRRWR